MSGDAHFALNYSSLSICAWKYLHKTKLGLFVSFLFFLFSFFISLFFAPEEVMVSQSESVSTQCVKRERKKNVCEKNQNQTKNNEKNKTRQNHFLL